MSLSNSRVKLSDDNYPDPMKELAWESITSIMNDLDRVDPLELSYEEFLLQVKDLYQVSIVDESESTLIAVGTERISKDFLEMVRELGYNGELKVSPFSDNHKIHEKNYKGYQLKRNGNVIYPGNLLQWGQEKNSLQRLILKELARA